MSRPSTQTKLKINKACDLNSISVLPPHSRRTTISMSQPSQLRSQSQQSFSQGMSSFSQSQLSQNSLDENLLNDQQFDSQERDKPAKRIPSLASGIASRDESQLQLSRTSNNVIRRWGSATVPDNKCQVSEELENRFRHMESSLNKMGMIMDSVQSDVMQVNRAVKEVSLETEGVRQKIVLLDNSLQHVIKEEQGLRAFLELNLKSLPEKIMESEQKQLSDITSTISDLPKRIEEHWVKFQESERKQLSDIASTISDLPKQVETHLVKFQREVCMVITKNREVIANGMKSFNNSYPDPIRSPKINWYAATGLSQKSQIQMPMLPLSSQTRRVPASRIETEVPMKLEPQLTGSKGGAKIPKTLPSKFSGSHKERYTRVTIESDEDSDGGLSCLVKKDTGKASCLDEEAREETARILRKARQRKRKHSKCIILD